MMSMAKATASFAAFRSLRRIPPLFSSRGLSASAPQEVEEKIPLPTEKTEFPEKIVKIVDDIANLTLLEVADLNSLLKTRLNITEAAPQVMMGSGFAAAAPAKAEEEEDVSAPAAVQTSFTIKLESFDAAKKVALIKELKANLEDMNLVQAKKFVESAPAVVKSDISKDEAENLKKKLEEVGATCTVD